MVVGAPRSAPTTPSLHASASAAHRPTGRRAAADLAEQELGFSRIQLDKLRQRPAPVRPPQPIPDDAPASDRLAALLGRTSVPLGDDGELRVAARAIWPVGV